MAQVTDDPFRSIAADSEQFMSRGWFATRGITERVLFRAGLDHRDLVESPNFCTQFLTFLRLFIGTVMEQDSGR
jgi:hypothetical protein